MLHDHERDNGDVCPDDAHLGLINRHTAGLTSRPRQVTVFVIEPSGGQVFIVQGPSGSTDAYRFENGSEEQRWELHHRKSVTS